MVSFEFLITSLVVVLIPGTGVLYTIATGIFMGKKLVLVVALGCTFGIVPSLLASIMGLAIIIHTSAVAFQIVKYVGVAYLLFLSWSMLRSTSSLSINEESKEYSLFMIAFKGFLINILNPKLTVFSSFLTAIYTSTGTTTYL
ncbi:LysE family translocator [Psychromonas sp. KJ10-10]|uniref:LysE family translocator n=1 Tax=Psychromonas sp. KJ10-10 TaxID=3391823 RepID=UPI0039B4858D